MVLPPLAFLATMLVLSTMGRDYEDIPRALEAWGIALIALGLLVASVGFTLAVGKERACPRCRAWWSARVQIGETTFETEHGHGRFTADGWKNRSRTTASSTYELTCQSCKYVFRQHRATRRTS